MNVRYSAIALTELDEILATIATDNPSAAHRLAARIERVVERLAQFPNSALRVAQRLGVRVVPLLRYPYLVHYTVDRDEIVILRVIHGARRQPWEEP
jgi:plasmid stabilization system protein ParE